MKNLRFDDRTTRSTRKVTDKFCHIRELWDSILDNCAKCFKPNIRLGERVVLKLMEPYFDMGLNVTTDNFFSSLELCKKLLVHKTTFIGTLRQNRREIPKEFLQQRLALYESRFLATDDGKILMVNYQAKRSKNVVLLSSFHRYATTEQAQKKKPSIILDYNKTKGVWILLIKC